MHFKLFKRFKNDRGGNFALITAIAFPVIFIFVAFAIDVVNLLRVRTELQNANDTGALFATRYFQVNNREATNAQVLEFVQANFPTGTVTSVGVQFDRAKNRFTVNATTKSKMMMMGYFGQNISKVDAVSQASLGVNGALEFSLALDTTASMLEDDRIGGLKVAAKNFVDILYDMKDRGADVKGAIVPFARYVNVGTSRRNEVWMSVPADIDTRKTERVCNDHRQVVGETNCRMEFTPARTVEIPATPGYCVDNDGFQKCYPGSPARTEHYPASNNRVCDPIYGEVVTTCQNVTTGRLITWHGCVSSREHPLNLSDPYDNKKFPGVLDVSCASELLPLTTSRSALVNKINGLVPMDNTYIPEGVMWGMRTLTQSQPFTEGRPPVVSGRKVRKALVVMTDGKNTLSPVVDNGSLSANRIVHNGTNEALANTYTSQACTHAKDAEIEVYTISFGNQVPNNIRDLLQACATKPTLYFHAANAAALNDAFNKIADELLSIRLTQ